MKFTKYLFLPAVAGLFAASCADLDTAPLGSTITSEQREMVNAQNPGMVVAGVNTLGTMMKQVGNAAGTTFHNDFGYPAMMIAMDTRGTDMVSDDIGYNWFSVWLTMEDIYDTYAATYIFWNTCYNQIFSANSVLAGIVPPAEGEDYDTTTKYYMAQALATRAFDYHVLAQCYAFTYKSHLQDPCVPIITEKNREAVAEAGGCPRATVEETYTQILDDLNTAIKYLEESEHTKSLTRDARGMFSVASARGLRARVYMCMEMWAEAAADAQWVIDNSGAFCLSRVEAGRPGFNSAEAANWLWSVNIEETDRTVTTGLCNFPSMMGSFTYGYASGIGASGAWKRINKALYESISTTDIRSGWFLNADKDSKNITDEEWAYAKDGGAYTQVKFAPYKGEVGTDVNASDIPLMRIEEMYLNLAEAQSKGGNPGLGAQTLAKWVKSYRDPAYVFDSTDATEVNDEIYRQRRIELWGEGLSWFDIKRLEIGVNRKGGGYEASLVYVVAANDPAMIFPIPQREMEANKLIGKNNPQAVKPKSTAE